MTAEKRGSIRGRVTTIDGSPVEGVNVLIAESSQPHHDIAVITNRNGEYTLDDLLPGDYTILATESTHAIKTADAKVSPGQPSTINFILTKRKPG